MAQGDEKDMRYLVALLLGLSTGVSFTTPLALFDLMLKCLFEKVTLAVNEIKILNQK